MHAVPSKPFPEKWNEFFHLFWGKSLGIQESFPNNRWGRCENSCSELVWPCVKQQYPPGHYLFVAYMWGRAQFLLDIVVYASIIHVFSQALTSWESHLVFNQYWVYPASAIVREPAFHHSAHCSHIMEAGTAEIKQHRELVRNVNDIAPIVSSVYSIVLTIVFQLKNVCELAWWNQSKCCLVQHAPSRTANWSHDTSSTCVWQGGASAKLWLQFLLDVSALWGMLKMHSSVGKVSAVDLCWKKIHDRVSLAFVLKEKIVLLEREEEQEIRWEEAEKVSNSKFTRYLWVQVFLSVLSLERKP